MQVPYELLNKKFRAAQKTIDREVAHIQSSAKELESVLQQKAPCMSDVSKAIDDVVEKLCLLKRKVHMLSSADGYKTFKFGFINHVPV